MANTKQVIPIFIFTAAVAVSILVYKVPEIETEPPAILVRTMTLNSDFPIKRFQIAGTTQSAETAVLRFQVSGRVTNKQVRLGDKVAKGDVLVKLYNPELEPLVQASKDNLARLNVESEQARSDFVRIDALYNEQAITRQEWETARTRLVASEKAVSASQSELERAAQVADELDLIAPFAGSVTEVLTDVGEVVSSGSPAIRLSNPDIVQLELAVSDILLSQIALGEKIAISKALQPTVQPTVGIVSEISPHRERGSLPEIIISLDGDKIGPGVAVNATVEIQAKQGLSIPIRSVLMTGDNNVAVYRVENGFAKLVAVRPTQINTNSVVIEQGLVAGDSLVVEGLSQLFDGARVVEAKQQINLDVQVDQVEVTQ